MMKKEVNDIGLFFFSFSREDCNARSSKIVNHIQHKVIFFPLLLPGCSCGSGGRRGGGSSKRGRDECRENIRQP